MDDTAPTAPDAPAAGTPAWLNTDQILRPETRKAIKRAEGLAWELMPRLIELASVAKQTHLMAAYDLSDVGDDAWPVLAQHSGYQRARDVLDVLAGFAVTASDDSVSSPANADKLASEFSGPDSPVDVNALVAKWTATVESVGWPS